MAVMRVVATVQGVVVVREPSRVVSMRVGWGGMRLGASVSVAVAVARMVGTIVLPAHPESSSS